MYNLFSYRKQPIDPVASIIEEMRTCTPPSTISNDSQNERPTGSKRVDERVAERAAEQERRRREAVRICISLGFCHTIIYLFF